jgi:hypothetical protein
MDEKRRDARAPECNLLCFISLGSGPIRIRDGYGREYMRTIKGAM